ncbi:MAG: LuxR C-terminal-related transcriptional regulator [Oligoflexia bacterium]|nr:LuxR C-terminal-related transcriptional regulator [Oligoflexia bacterium]
MSNRDLRDLTEEDGCTVCIKDIEGRVEYQNAKCLEACGERTGLVCKDGCMELYSAKTGKKGGEARPILMPSRKIRDKHFDALFLRGKSHLTTILYPIEEQISESVKALDGFDLTPREKEIAELLVRGLSNREIMAQLFISKPTLKTHVNRIYKKLGPAREKIVKRPER